MYDIIFFGTKDSLQYKELKHKYPTLKNADTFEKAKQISFTKFFWLVWDDVEILDTFDFSYIPDDWSQEYIHIFKNGLYFDGVILVPNSVNLSSKELNYRFFFRKKEVDVQASIPVVKRYDVVFISYDEPNADENYKHLLTKVPNAKRVHKVKGIHQAHLQAAQLCDTDLFYVVDGDASIVDDFYFDYQVETWNKDAVHVWRSKNPINDLEYGYGGVKLLPRQATLNMDLTAPDMTTSISNKFKVVDQTANITAFNTDPWNTWKSAFRECAKLASKTIQRQLDTETDERLSRWTSDYGRDRAFGDYAIQGARLGRMYGVQNRDDLDALKKINDFEWLYEQFSKNTL